MRNLTSEMATEFSGKSVSPILMADLFFAGGRIGVWTGRGTITFGGNDYLGAGLFCGISEVQETQELEAKGLVVSLNGISSSLVAAGFERVRGRPFKMYLASVSTSRYLLKADGASKILLANGSGFLALQNSLINAPYRMFSGLMDYIETVDNGVTCDMRLNVESILITGQRSKVSRYTDEDQQNKYPGDLGLSLINSLQDKEVSW